MKLAEMPMLDQIPRKCKKMRNFGWLKVFLAKSKENTLRKYQTETVNLITQDIKISSVLWNHVTLNISLRYICRAKSVLELLQSCYFQSFESRSFYKVVIFCNLYICSLVNLAFGLNADDMRGKVRKNESPLRTNLKMETLWGKLRTLAKKQSQIFWSYI